MSIRKVLLGLTLILLWANGAAIAADVNKGLQAYKAGDYKTALSQWIPFADSGNASAQSNLGFMYERGHGVPQNYNAAAKWYTLAAEQGDIVAQFNLGGLYDAGKGVVENDKTAVKWLTLASKQGYARAQSYLGVMYVNGHGVPTDYLRAYMWWSVGSHNGDLLAAQYKQSIATKMTPAHVTKAHEMYSSCLRSNYTDC